MFERLICKEPGVGINKRRINMLYSVGLIYRFHECKLEDKMDFWNDFIAQALNYSTIRCKWELMSREEHMEADR